MFSTPYILPVLSINHIAVPARNQWQIVSCNIKANPPIIITYNPITNIELFNVWGRSPNDVYAVGWFCMILHFDGNTWSQMDSGVGSDLLGVWGESGGDVFAVGYHDTILRKKAQ